MCFGDLVAAFRFNYVDSISFGDFVALGAFGTRYFWARYRDGAADSNSTTPLFFSPK